MLFTKETDKKETEFLNEIKNPTESIGNRADQMEERKNDLGIEI